MGTDYDQLKAALKEPALNAKLFSSQFGLEAKKHRILTNGRASRYPYPENLRSRQYNIYLNSGFTDDMMDFETSPVVGATNAVRQLKMLEQIVISQLHSDERLWPLSMAPGPTYQHDLEYLKTSFTKTWDQDTHDYLGKKYGIVQEILGDVHVNFSLDSGLIDELYQRFYVNRYPSRIEFQNHLYFKLAQKFCLYQWLFTYLYGASPVSKDMPHSIPDDLQLPVRSLRCSDYGDDNFTNEQVTYASFDQHFTELRRFMNDGTYYSMKEFFGPVRLRRHNHDTRDVTGALQAGIDYLEFRNFDLDPLSRTGISDATINFLELMLLNSILSPLPDNLTERLTEAKKRNNEVALQKPKDQLPWMYDAAMELIAELQNFIVEFNAPREYQLALKFVQRRVDDPSLTLSGQLADQLEDGDLLSFGLKIANDRYTKNINFQHPLQAISDVYSDDIQRLVRAAIELGIQVELQPMQVILHVGDHKESYEAQARFDFSKGARDLVLADFPEAKQFQEEN
ncbi:glutamate--cysteine ligase [uncultured Limosilactobacillus sp.]|uniref:glutamate--cysteine ligase n=1 Tax=uncultured Limosilactobacillus sp. TaxID=2837629 RepID=UPI00272DB4E7|nr:glutamate--cysteine ligase [uncultured Limosilactobacillus sp.]